MLDIKSKKWQYSGLLKSIAALLGAAGMVALVFAVLQMAAHQAVLTGESFEDSYVLREGLYSVQNQVEKAAFTYGSFSRVASGGAIDKTELAERGANLMSEKTAKIEATQERYEEWIVTAEEHQDREEINRLLAERENHIQAIEEEYAGKLQAIETQMAAHQAVLTGESFEDSYVLREGLYSVQNQVEKAAFTYGAFSRVASGGAIDKTELAERGANLMSEKTAKIEATQERYEEWIVTAEEHQDREEINRLLAEREAHVQAIEEEYAGKLQAIETQIIQQQLNDYKEIIARLENSDAYFFVALPGDKVFTNLGDNVRGEEDAPFVKPVAQTGYVDQDDLLAAIQRMQDTVMIETDNGLFFLSLKEDAFKMLESQFEQRLAAGRYWLQVSAVGAAVFLLAWLYLLYAAGRRPSDPKTVYLTLIDRMYLDVGAVVTLSLIGGGVAVLGSLGYVYGKFQLTYPGGLVIVLGTLVGYVYTMSVAKRIKRREFFRHTLAAKIWQLILQGIRQLVALIHGLLFSSVTLRRVVLAMLIYLGGVLGILFLTLVLTAPLGPLGLLAGGGLLLVFHLWILQGLRSYVEGFNLVLAGAQRIAAGDLAHRIEVGKLGDIARLAAEVNRITEGLDKAVAQEVKAERLKAELISNVSHDLRTPMTVIRTYIDLLKTEGLTAQGAAEYLRVLDEKSMRLQKLTEDLFEAAKASSGSIPVKLERVNLTSLVRQSMGELSEGMHASGLNFITRIDGEELWVTADGGLLWRVLENLFGNVFKYAMPGSRVYVEVAGGQEKNLCCFTLKNTSAEALNIPAEELLQRFKRGDEARSSEGSGLGLAIAKNLVELQGGQFTLLVDGDLFKVEICLPAAEKQEEGK